MAENSSTTQRNVAIHNLRLGRTGHWLSGFSSMYRPYIAFIVTVAYVPDLAT